MVPLVPLLFLLCVPVLHGDCRLGAVSRWTARVLVSCSLFVSAAVSMTRENVVEAVTLTLRQGPTLPMLLVLRRTAAAYAPWLTGAGAQPLGVILVGAVAFVAWLVWWRMGASEPTHNAQHRT